MAGTLADVKKTFLRLLEEDEEFRYAVAAKIGLLKILEKLDSHDRKFNEILERLDRHEEILLRHEEEIKKIWMKLEEHDRKFNEILERLDRHEEEIKKIWEKLEEHDRKFNEILERLDRHEEILLRHEEEIKKIWEEIREIKIEIKKIWEKLSEHSDKLSRIELELGTLAESFYCKALWDDLREEIIGRGEKVLVRRRNARIDGTDIDLFVETDRSVYIVEVKVKPKHPDVGALTGKADLVRRHYPDKDVIPILAGALVGREIEEYARSKGVRVYVY